MNRFAPLPSILAIAPPQVKKWLRFMAIALGSSILVITMGWTMPLFSQTSSLDRAAQQIYLQLPDFPLGNNFSLAQGNQPLENETLLSRLLRYHRSKLRNNESRFDWKLTLADYLGVNEPIIPDRYPGSSTLTVNPFDQDQAMVNELNREQREELIIAIVNFYNPTAIVTDEPPAMDEVNPNQNPADEIYIPRPGDASLLGF